MNSTIKSAVLMLSFLLHPLFLASAEEGVGRAGLKPLHGFEIETEFYASRGGYVHGGLGVVGPLNSTQKMGITAHFVREDSGGEIFPSLGAEFVQELSEDVEVELFSFGYFPVE